MFFNFSQKIAHWDKYYYTLYFVLTNFSYGFLFSLFPNILVDMRYILNTSMSLISLYTTAETLGYIMGTLSGLTYKYLNRQIVVGLAYFMLTIICTTIPLVPNIWVLYVFGFLFGFGSSTYVAGYVVWVMDLWKHRAGPVLQLLDFSFAVGSIICPIILKPFVVGETNHNNNIPSSTESTFIENYAKYTQFDVNNEMDPNDIDRRARLMVPILIIGVCIIPIPISSLIMYFIKPYKTPEIETKQMTEDLTEELKYEEKKLFDRPETPRKTIRMLCALWYTFYVIFETVFLKFAVTYFQYCPLKLTAQQAAEIFSVSMAVYAAFRGINILIALKLKIVYIISYHYVILIVALILLFFGQNNLTVFWIASLAMCWGFSAMFSGIYTYTGQQLTMTNQLNTIFTLTRGLFTLVVPYVIGLYMVDFSQIFLIVELIFFICSLIVFLFINYMIRKYTKIFEK